MEGGPSTDVYVPPPRKWKTNLSKAQVTKIQQHKEKYGKYLEMHNQTQAQEVWKIYDHVAAELLKEQLDTVLTNVVQKDLEKWLVEQVIVDEF